MTRQTKIIVFLVIVILILITGYYLWPEKNNEQTKPPDQGAREIPSTGLSILSGTAPALPIGRRPKAGEKVITIKSIQDIKKGQEVKIFVPKEGRSWVLGDSGKAVIGTDSSLVEVTELVFKNPWLFFNPHIMLGAGVTDRAIPTPMGGVSLFTVWQKVHLGGMVDKFGIGPFGSWEFFREFNLTGKLNLVPFDNSRWTVGITYRL